MQQTLKVFLFITQFNHHNTSLSKVPDEVSVSVVYSKTSCGQQPFQLPLGN